MSVTRWDILGDGPYIVPDEEGPLVKYEDHLAEVRKLEHIIEGLNEQLLRESEQIAMLEPRAKAFDYLIESQGS